MLQTKKRHLSGMNDKCVNKIGTLAMEAIYSSCPVLSRTVPIFQCLPNNFLPILCLKDTIFLFLLTCTHMC